MPRRDTPFLTIRSEGALLPPDLLQRVPDWIGDGDLPGLTPADYHLAPNERLSEAVTRAWNRLLGAWTGFRDARSDDTTEAGATLARERWLLPLFQELGYGRLLAARAVELDGKTYPVSHQWGETPIHLVGWKITLDERTAGVAGAARSSPHSLVQELLNRSAGMQWGIVSNGLRLRVLRDNASLTRQAFLEFDLEAMMDGEAYADFAVLWLMCHQSRLESAADGEGGCWLERWSHAARQRGTRALDQLRDGVQRAIELLGGGFLQHRDNAALRAKLRRGELTTQDFYRQTLRWAYRLIFLFVAEDRGALLDPGAGADARERYTRFYSTAWLRGLAERQRGTEHHDVFQAARLVSQKLGSDAGCPELGLPALGGFLFGPQATPDLDGCELTNRALLGAVRALAFTQEGSGARLRSPRLDRGRGFRRAVDFRNLGPEELGSVYESLLEMHPNLNTDAGTFMLETASGSERKTTGSYYTPTSLISSLLDTALEPVIADALGVKRNAPPAEREAALLALRVCDPASGSGHFLIAAAHRLAKRLAQVRSGGDEPSPAAYRRALRDVIGRCIYGVDVNPMAVELCKINLWLESLEPGRPLSFLDQHIQCGNALLGATPELIAQGVPDEAFTPITGDDKAICAEYKKRNRKERGGQMALFDAALRPWEHLGSLAAGITALDTVADDTIAGVRAREQRYAELVRGSDYLFNQFLADAWCAAFVWKKSKDFAYPITTETLRQIEHNPYAAPAWMRDEVRRLVGRYQFFHWHLAFPELFPPGADGGFDAVLGNPPWEMLQLDPRVFFAQRDPRVSAAPNMSARDRLIKELERTDPALHSEFIAAKRDTDAQQQFIHASSRFPLTSYGRINLMALFAELARKVIGKTGRAGLILPTGIATDSFNQYFFADLVKSGSIASLFDFENREGLFPAIDSRMKFCLLTMSTAPVSQPEFSFFATNVEHLHDERRRFSLSQQNIRLLNPNTLTCPVFRTRADAELTRNIYERIPVLVNESAESNPWGVRFQLMFMMNTDSHLFNCDPASSECLPLYEAKLLHQFDHRWATYGPHPGPRPRAGEGADARDCTLAEKRDPNFRVTPRYWVSAAEVEARLGEWQRGWLLGFRDIARSTDERTAIFGLLPRVGVGHKAPLLFLKNASTVQHVACALSNLNALVFDYSARQKVGGTSLGYFILKQLPVLPPDRYSAADLDFIVPRVVELSYTAWDLLPFAQDVLAEVGEEAWARWFPHNSITPNPSPIGRGEFVPQPFVWDEERRAHLRAELDAYYARLYGLTRDELRYILDPRDVHGEDFPGETFRVLKERELREFGEYRTRRLVLEKWDGSVRKSSHPAPWPA